MNDCRRASTVVYACSGSSNVAQLANAIAVRLDREGSARMSCIAGVGGGVEPIVRIARAARRIVVIDGCPLGCCEAALALRGVRPDRVVKLHERGLRKRQHVDYAEDERDRVFADVRAELASLLDAESRPARRGSDHEVEGSVP